MKYVVYGSDDCPYCVRATSLLESKGIKYKYKNIKKDDQAREYIVNELNAKTIPQIFEGDQHIGGYSELEKHLKDEEFDNLF